MSVRGAPVSDLLISPDGLWLYDDNSVEFYLTLTGEIDSHPDYDAPSKRSEI